MKARIIQTGITAVLIMTVVMSIAQVLNSKSKQPEISPAQETANKVTEYKQKSRESLKPYRYDACNVTHFTYSGYEQKKEIEVLLFNGTEYKLIFNTEGSPKPISIRIFDKPVASQTRIEIDAASNVQGGETSFMSTDLLEKYKAKRKAESEEKKTNIDVSKLTLKRVYIDYIIPANDTKEPLKGFALLTYGYKNI